jgi:chromosome segregation ATPase
MNSSASLLSVEVKQAFKSLNHHVRALVDLAHLHRINDNNNNNNHTASDETHHLNDSDPSQSLILPTSTSQSASVAHQLDLLTQQVSRASADNDALRLQVQVLSEQSRQKSDKLRALLAAVDELQARADVAERAAADARQQLETEREVLSEVRVAFLASTERLDEIDAERSRFTRHAATLRQQNEQLRAHVARLDKHAHYLAEKLESRIISSPTQHHP